MSRRLSLSEGFERSRSQLAAGRDEVQKKTFTKWINSCLIQADIQVVDLYKDLRDGQTIMLLLEMLTGEKLPKEKGSMRFHKLQNLNTVLAFLAKKKVETVNISADHILDGNPKLTLGLVWRLILHFQLSSDTEAKVNVSELKADILDWCRKVTDGYEDVNVTNFTTSWKSGLALNAIIHRFRPDLVDYDALDQSQAEQNLERVFSTAAEELAIPRLLDVSDLAMSTPDENSVLTYISFFKKAFPEDIPARHNVTSLARECWTKYAAVAKPLIGWIRAKLQWLEEHTITEQEDLNEAKEFQQELSTFWEGEVKTQSRENDKAKSLFEQFEAANSQSDHAVPIEDGLHVDDVNKAWHQLQQACFRQLCDQESLVARLEKESAVAAILDKICDCKERLCDLEMRVNEFQAEAGKPRGRDDMNSTADHLADETQAVKGELESLLTQFTDLTNEPDSNAECKAQLETLLGLCGKLVGQLAESGDAICILRDADDILGLSLEDVKAKRKPLKESVEKLQLAHEGFLSKHTDLENTNPHDLAAQIANASSHLKCVLAQLGDELSQAVQQFSDWLASVEEKLLTETGILHRYETVKIKQSEPLKGLAESVRSQHEEFVTVMNLRGDAEDGETAALFVGVPERWSAVQTEIDKRVQHLSSVEHKLKSYEDELNSLGNWLAWAEGELDMLCRHGNTSVLVQEQVDKCEKLLSDVNAHEPYVKSTSVQGQNAVYAGKLWQKLLDGFSTELGKIKGVPTFEEVVQREYNKADDPIATEAVPEELKKVDERFKHLVLQFEERLAHLRQHLEKAKHTESLFDRIVAFLKGSKRLRLDDSVDAGVGTIDPYIDQIQEWQPSWRDHDALLKEAIATQQELLPVDGRCGKEDQDEPDGVDVAAQLTQQMLILKKKSEDRKEHLLILKEQCESFDRENNKLLYALAGVENAEEQRNISSLDEDILIGQIKEEEALRLVLLENEPVVEKIKTIAEALLANPMATEGSKQKHQQQLAEALNCYSHASLLSTARHKQLVMMHAQLAQFKKLWSPSSGYLSRLEEQVIVCGPPAVDKQTLGEQLGQSEERQKAAESVQTQLDDVISAGQQLLLTYYAVPESNQMPITDELTIAVTDGNSESSAITDEVKEITVKEKMDKTTFQTGTTAEMPQEESLFPNAELPPGRSMKKGGADHTRLLMTGDGSAVPAVDVLKMAAEAVEANRANWVEVEYVALLKRLPKVIKLCQERTDRLQAMTCNVEAFESTYNLLDTFLSASEERAKQIRLQESISPTALEKQLSDVKALLGELEEKEAEIEAAVLTGQGLIETHDIVLVELQEQLAQLTAARGLSINKLYSSPLDETTAPGVKELKKRIEALKHGLNTLRKDVSVCAADREASLAAAKDADSAISSLHHHLDKLDKRMAALKQVAADRSTLDGQTDEQKELDIEISSMQAKVATLNEQLANKLDQKAKKDLEDASLKCQGQVGLLAERQSTLSNADNLVSKIDSLDGWLSQQEAYLEALPADCRKSQLEKLQADLLEKSDNFKDVETEYGVLTTEFQEKVDSDTFNLKFAALSSRLSSLQATVESRVSFIEEEEAAAGRLVIFHQLSKLFLEWIEDMESTNGLIGLTHESVHELASSLQRVADAMDGKRHELDKLFEAASAASITAKDSHSDSDSSGQAMKEATMLKERFAELASTARLEKVNLALVKAEEFEQPFVGLAEELLTFEKEMHTLTRPISSIVDESENQLNSLEELLMKVAAVLPNVHKICNIGNELEQLSEVDEGEKEKFHNKVEKLRNRWMDFEQHCLDHADKLSRAVKETRTFLDDHLNPLLEWMNEVDVLISPEYPVGGDRKAVQSIKEQLKAVRAECSQQEERIMAAKTSAAKTSGKTLIGDVLEESTVTEEQLGELHLRWDALQEQLDRQEKRVAEAEEAASLFEDEFETVNAWLASLATRLSSMEAVSPDDIGVLEKQEKEIQELSTDIDENLPQLQGVLKKGKALIESSPPGRCEELKARLVTLEEKRRNLAEAVHKRTVEIDAALLALQGLHDGLRKASSEFENLEQAMSRQEAGPIGDNIDGVFDQLEELQGLMQSVDVFQTQLDALHKVHQKHLQEEMKSVVADPQMQVIVQLEEHTVMLRERTAARRQDLEDALETLEEADAENFDVAEWRQKFVSWVDANLLQLRAIFSTFDPGNSQTLSREEFISGLSACGYSMTHAELNKLADYFDEDSDGEINYMQFAKGLRPERRVVFSHKARNDEEAVIQAVSLACAECTCTNQFEIKEVSKGCYYFGESHLKRLVRILRTKVMVRVGGGWEDLESFVKKHDPCRAVNRTNIKLFNLPVTRGLSMVNIPVTRRKASTPTETEQVISGRKRSGGPTLSPRTRPDICPMHTETSPASSPMSGSASKYPMAIDTPSPGLTLSPKGVVQAGQRLPGSRPLVTAASASGHLAGSSAGGRPHTKTTPATSSTQRLFVGGKTFLDGNSKGKARQASSLTANHNNSLSGQTKKVGAINLPEHPAGSDKEAVQSTKEQLEVKEFEHFENPEAARAEPLQQKEGTIESKKSGENVNPEALDGQMASDKQLSELQMRWEALREQLNNQEKRAAEAEEAASPFADEFHAINTWLASVVTRLLSMEGTSHNDINLLKKQYQEMRELNPEVSENLSRVEYVLEKGKVLIESGSPGRCEELKAKLATLEEKRRNLTEAVHKRNVEIDAALPALQNLHDALRKVSGEFGKLERVVSWHETEPLGGSAGNVIDQSAEGKAAAEDFDFEKWCQEFVRWMDANNLQLQTIFPTFSADSSLALSWKDFIGGLSAYGYSATRAEMNKLANYLDKESNGEIDYASFAASLQPERRIVLGRKSKLDEEVVAQAVSLACAQCTCTKQFEIQEVGRGCYRFGESQKKRSLRAKVMVEVDDGGWVELESFVKEKDPCHTVSSIKRKPQRRVGTAKGTNTGSDNSPVRPSKIPLPVSSSSSSPKHEAACGGSVNGVDGRLTSPSRLPLPISSVQKSPSKVQAKKTEGFTKVQLEHSSQSVNLGRTQRAVDQ